MSVVKAYAATSDLVFVTFDRNVDFPTEGNPTRAIRASPDFETSKPEPAAPPAPGPGSRSCARRRASFLNYARQKIQQSRPRTQFRTLLKAQDDTLHSVIEWSYMDFGCRTSRLVLLESR